MVKIIAFPKCNFGQNLSNGQSLERIDNALICAEMLAYAEQLRDQMAFITQYLETLQRRLSAL